MGIINKQSHQAHRFTYGRTSIVEPILFIYLYNLYGNIPVSIQIIYKKVCLHNFNNNATYCDELSNDHNDTQHQHDQNLVQQLSAQFGIYSTLAQTLPALIPCVFIGAWSDKMGRKIGMVAPFVCQVVQAVGNMICAYYMESSAYYLLIISGVISCFGGFASILQSTFSYVTDITTKENRTKRTVILESMIYAAALLSSLAGGVILQKFGYVYSYMVQVILAIVALVYLIFLKESRVVLNKPSVRELIDFGFLKDAFQVFTRRRVGRCRATLNWLLAILFCNVACFMVLSEILVIYMKHSPRNFQSDEIGYLLGENQAFKFLGNVIIMVIIGRFVKLSDYALLVVNLVFYFGLFFAFAFSYSKTEMYLGCLFSIGNGIGMPANRAAMSKMVSSDEQGKMFSVVAALEVFSAMVTGIVTLAIYKATVSFAPNYTLFVAAFFCLLPLLATICVWRWGEGTPYTTLVEQVDMKIEADRQVDYIVVEGYNNPAIET